MSILRVSDRIVSPGAFLLEALLPAQPAYRGQCSRLLAPVSLLSAPLCLVFPEPHLVDQQSFLYSFHGPLLSP